jgi:hypothetical protein
MKNIAFGYVITGDIEGFTKIRENDRNELIKDFEIFLTQIVEHKLYAQVFRGDSYQLFFTNVEQCLDAIFKIKCWLMMYKNFELQNRNALGIGSISFINENILKSDGEAFHLSGRTFDVLSKGEFLTIITSKSKLNEQLQVILLMVNLFVDKWTLQQAEVILQDLKGNTQVEIAEKLSISQGAVNNRLKVSNWKEIKEVNNYLKKILRHVK